MVKWFVFFEFLPVMAEYSADLLRLSNRVGPKMVERVAERRNLPWMA